MMIVDESQVATSKQPQASVAAEIHYQLELFRWSTIIMHAKGTG